MNKWLWFIGLYIISVIIVAGVAYLIKVFISL